MRFNCRPWCQTSGSRFDVFCSKDVQFGSISVACFPDARPRRHPLRRAGRAARGRRRVVLLDALPREQVSEGGHRRRHHHGAWALAVWRLENHEAGVRERGMRLVISPKCPDTVIVPDVQATKHNPRLARLGLTKKSNTG